MEDQEPLGVDDGPVGDLEAVVAAIVIVGVGDVPFTDVAR